MNFLQEAIQKNEKIQKQNKKTKYVDPKLIQILENFIVSNQLVCYGGIAINNILPKNEQFYNYDIDIPDYDFFSPRALDHAKELCDIFAKENVYHVESKSAFFFGTYKVFVNFVPIADITQIHDDFYNYLLKTSIIVDKINYTSPDFLRMSLHQELSRPLGDVSRWEKIYNRMNILNKYYPIVETFETSDNRHLIPDTLQKNYIELIKSFIEQKSIICTPHFIECIYKKYLPSKYKKLITCPTNLLSVLNQESFIMYHNNLKDLIKNLKTTHNGNIVIKEIKSIYKFMKDYAEIYIDNIYVGTVFELDSCMSYYDVTINKLNVKIANIDTLLHLYFAILIVDNNSFNKTYILNLIHKLYKIIINYTELNIKYIESNPEKHKPLVRFHLPCLGEQDDYEKILKMRFKQYKALKDNKSSVEYKKWFFKYVPRLKNKSMVSKRSKTKTIKKTKTKKSKLNKTSKI